jgi:hypothetical protein
VVLGCRDNVPVTDEVLEANPELMLHEMPRTERSFPCPLFRVALVGAAAAVRMAPPDCALLIQLPDPTVVRIVSRALADSSWVPPPGRKQLHSYDGAEADVRDILGVLRRRHAPTSVGRCRLTL